MELSYFLFLVGSLACPIIMCTTMWLMSRNMGRQSNQATPGDPTPANLAERVAWLRAQQQALEAEIAEVTRLMELEAQREGLLIAPPSDPDPHHALVVQNKV
jgi:hypothetical protein